MVLFQSFHNKVQSRLCVLSRWTLSVVCSLNNGFCLFIQEVSRSYGGRKKTWVLDHIQAKAMINFTPTVSTVSHVPFPQKCSKVTQCLLSDECWILTWSPGYHTKVFKASCCCWSSTGDSSKPSYSGLPGGACWDFSTCTSCHNFLSQSTLLFLHLSCYLSNLFHFSTIWLLWGQ